MKDAEKYSEHILSIITNVRNDYSEELKKSIQTFAKTAKELSKNISTIGRAFSDAVNLPATLNKAISKIIEASQMGTSPNALSEAVKKTDWNAIDEELRSNNPEMKNILERFDNNDVNSVVKEMQKELDEGVNNSN